MNKGILTKIRDKVTCKHEFQRNIISRSTPSLTMAVRRHHFNLGLYVSPDDHLIALL